MSNLCRDNALQNIGVKNLDFSRSCDVKGHVIGHVIIRFAIDHFLFFLPTVFRYHAPFSHNTLLCYRVQTTETQKQEQTDYTVLGLYVAYVRETASNRISCRPTNNTPQAPYS